MAFTFEEKMKNPTSLLLACVFILSNFCLAGDETQFGDSKVTCSGMITSYMKDQTPAQLIKHGCVWLKDTPTRSDDATWIKILEPKEYRGVTHVQISNEGKNDSPYGQIGDVIQISISRKELDEDKKWSSTEINKS